MKHPFKTLLLILPLVLLSAKTQAFCGFYVAKADAKLFNNKSEVIMVRDGKRNIITMSSDFKGSLKDFAMVVPVPVILKEKDIRVIERNIFDVLNDYSAPRLVEYYDNNPCYPQMYYDDMSVVESLSSVKRVAGIANVEEKEFGVTIEAQYSIEEYEVMILSATESTGLKDWLILNGYQIPVAAEEVLSPYIKSNMKFFVVKVNVDKAIKNNGGYLRPIQLSFTHDKFMLPLRLGMANSEGTQDMIVYAFTRTGRVECTNYRTVKMPTDRNIPLYVQPRFGEFYKSLFNRTYKAEGRNAVFLEYAWNVSPYTAMKCDPCVGPPPINQDFVTAGVDWLNSPNPSIYFTRLHVRYSRDKFPSDLQFQVTPNTENFQCRYILTHPAQGDFACSEGQDYLNDLYNRRKREIDEAYVLAGWSMDQKSINYLNEYVSQMQEKPQQQRNEVIPAFGDEPGGNEPRHPLPGILILAAMLSVLFFTHKKTQTVGT